jgi:outer membrane protein assembly factor BamB
MRLPLAMGLLTLACATGIVVYVLVGLPSPPPDTVRHVAITRSLASAINTTPLAFEPIPLVADLSQRAGSDWPAFLGPTGDGKSPEVGIEPWSVNGPRVVWTLDVGEGYAAPTVCRGRLLIFDRVKSLARCRCLRCETGDELWRFTYPTDYTDRQAQGDGPRACPVTDGCLVYLHGVEGMLHCLRFEDGKLLWKVDTLSTFGIVQNLFGVASAPIIDDERLLVQIGGSPEGSSDKDFMGLTSSGSCLVAFDKRTGQVLYQCGHDLASYASPRVVTVGDQKLGLMFARAGLLGFDPEHGEQLFHLPFRSRSYNSVNASNPVVHGNQIFLTESYEVGCALLSTNHITVQTIWSASPRERDRGLCCHWNTPVLVDGHLYGCASRHRGDAELRCIEWATGKVKWIARPALGDEPAGRGSLLYVDGHLFYLVEEGWLFLLKANPERFEQIAAWDGRKLPAGLKHPCWSNPVLARGLLYAQGKGRLACLELIGSR